MEWLCYMDIPEEERKVNCILLGLVSEIFLIFSYPQVLEHVLVEK